MSLGNARQQRDILIGALASGLEPKNSTAKQTIIARHITEADLFQTIARQWIKQKKSSWSPVHFDRYERMLNRDAIPVLGRTALNDIQPSQVLEVIRNIRDRGSEETARRCLQMIRTILVYSGPFGYLKGMPDPTAGIELHLGQVAESHFAAIVDPKQLGDFLRAVNNYSGSPLVTGLIKLQAHLFCRPSELRNAKWSDFDIEAKTFTIPSERLKRSVKNKQTGEPHIVPLSEPVIGILQSLPRFVSSELVFQSQKKDRALSDNAGRTAIYALGFGDAQSMHGFRATARTILEQDLKYERLIVEAELGHYTDEPLGRAYARATFLEDRRAMMQAWSEMLECLRTGQDYSHLVQKKHSN
jgi:integrase